jgi:hypothetical protein
MEEEVVDVATCA